MDYITCPRCEHSIGLAQVTTEKIFCSKCGQKMRVRSPQATQQQNKTNQQDSVYTGAVPERESAALKKEFTEDFASQTQEFILDDDLCLDYGRNKKSIFTKILCLEVLVIATAFPLVLFAIAPAAGIAYAATVTIFVAAYLIMPTMIAHLCEKKGRDDTFLLWFASVVFTPVAQLAILIMICLKSRGQSATSRRY